MPQWYHFAPCRKARFKLSAGFLPQGRPDIAERLYLSAIEEGTKGWAADDPHVAATRHNLAELYRIQRRYTDAEPLYTLVRMPLHGLHLVTDVVLLATGVLSRRSLCRITGLHFVIHTAKVRMGYVSISWLVTATAEIFCGGAGA